MPHAWVPGRGLKSLGSQGPQPGSCASPWRGCSPAFVGDGFFFWFRWGWFSFGFHSFVEKDSGKRKGEEQLKGETEPRGAAPHPSGAT